MDEAATNNFNIGLYGVKKQGNKGTSDTQLFLMHAHNRLLP